MEEEGSLGGEEKVRAREAATRTPLQPRYRPSVCLFMCDCENRGTSASVLPTADQLLNPNCLCFMKLSQLN